MKSDFAPASIVFRILFHILARLKFSLSLAFAHFNLRTVTLKRAYRDLELNPEPIRTTSLSHLSSFIPRD